MVSSLTFHSLIPFEFILVYGVRRWHLKTGGLVSFFCMHLSNIPNTIYWIDCLYPTVRSCLLCQILINYKGMGLFLGSLLCSIDLCVCFYASTVLFWSVWTYNIAFYQAAWFLQFCSTQYCYFCAWPFVFPYKFLKHLF